MSFDIAYNFTAVDKFSPTVDKINQKISNLQAKMAKASATAGKVNRVFNKLGSQLSVKVGAPFALMGQKIIRTSTDFERSMNMLQAVTGASTQQMEKFRKQAIWIGQTTIFTARQAANAQVAMAKAGANINQVLAGMPANANAAAAAQEDLGDMAKITAGALASVGLKAKDLTHLSDLLGAASNATLTNMQELGTSFRFVGARARLAGIPLNETVAMMAQILKSGVPASQAARWFSQAIIKMQKPTALGAKILKALNIEFTDAHGKIKPLLPIIAKLEKLKELKVLKPAGFQELFGTRGANALGSAVQEGSDSLRTLLTILDKANGTTRRMAETQMQGLPGAVARLTAAFEHVQLVIERTNNTLAIGFVDAITKTLLGISHLNPTIQRLFVETGAFFTILGPLLIVLGKVLAVMTFVGIISGGTALAIGGITVAVIALIAAFVLLWKKSEKFRNFFMQVGRGYKNLFEIGSRTLNIFHAPAPPVITPAAPPAMSFAPGRMHEPQLVKSLLNINVRDNAGIIKSMHGTSDSDHFEMNTGLNMSLAR
jgi:TP901 family phage tail tape measure protein